MSANHTTCFAHWCGIHVEGLTAAYRTELHLQQQATTLLRRLPHSLSEPQGQGLTTTPAAVGKLACSTTVHSAPLVTSGQWRSQRCWKRGGGDGMPLATCLERAKAPVC
jgi:hypothetical protein